MKDIRDPMRDEYISISDEFLPIVDSEELQRLRNIQQLGFSSLVYPGATHTRFSHTLGVFWMTKQFIDSLDLEGTDTSRQLKLAALLHDTGHGPYSHVIETVEGIRDHEERSLEAVENMANRGLINESDVIPIQEFILGERDPGIVSGSIDSDRMDYLSRDAHYTGISHGLIDSETIIEGATLQDDKIVFKEMAIQAIESLLISRKNMHGSVYQHPTVRSAEKMLSECVERSEEITQDTIQSHDDKTLHYILKTSDDPIVRDLYDKITNRELYKPAFSLRKMHNINPDSVDKQAFEADLREEVSAAPHELFIDWYTSKPHDLSIDVLVDGDITNFEDISNVNEVIYDNGYSVYMSVYTPEEYREQVKNYSKNWLGL